MKDILTFGNSGRFSCRAAFFTVLVTLLIMGGSLHAQTLKVNDVSAGRVVEVTGDVDSLDNISTKAFSLGKNILTDWSANPVRVGYLIASESGTPKVRCILQGSYDDTNFFNVDTLFADSSETFMNTTANLNGGKYPLYRVYLTGYTGNRADTNVKLWIYAYKDEY